MKIIDQGMNRETAIKAINANLAELGKGQRIDRGMNEKTVRSMLVAAGLPFNRRNRRAVLAGLNLAFATPAFVTLPTDADIAYAYAGATLVADYSGPLATACASNAPDTPTVTVPIYAGPNGKANEADAIAAFGSSYHIWKWHDQKGLCGDLTATTASTRQVRNNNFPSFPFHSYNEALQVHSAATPNIERSTFSLFEVLAGPMQGANSEVTASMGDGFTAGFSSLSEVTGRGLLVQGAGFIRSALYHGVRPTVASTVFSPTTVKFRVDAARQTVTGAVTPLATMNGLKLGTGWQPASGKHFFGMVAYKRTLSDADEALISARLSEIFAITPKTAQILAEGDSIQRGQGATLGRNKWAFLSEGLPATVHIINAGVPNSGQQSRDLAFFNARRIANGNQIWMQNWGSNNFPTGMTAATLFGADNTTGTRFNVANAKAAGFKPILETVIARGTYNAAQETERKAFNQLLRDNAAALGYWLIDYGDTVYPTTDTIHPTTAGYQAMAAIALPVILAALAA